MIFEWFLLTVIFFGALVLALALARTAARGDEVLSHGEVGERLRPSGGVSMHVEPRP